MIAKSLGLKMKNTLKASAVPTTFKNGHPQTKTLLDKNMSQDALAGPSKQAQKSP